MEIFQGLQGKRYFLDFIKNEQSILVDWKPGFYAKGFNNPINIKILGKDSL